MCERVGWCCCGCGCGCLCVGVGGWVGGCGCGCVGVGVQSCSVREPLPFPSLATQPQSAPKSLEQQQLGMCSDYTIGAWTQHGM